MKRSREDLEASYKEIDEMFEEAALPVSSDDVADEQTAPAVEAGMVDVAPEPHRINTGSGDGGDGAARRDDRAPSNAAAPSVLQAAYEQIDEMFEEDALPVFSEEPRVKDEACDEESEEWELEGYGSLDGGSGEDVEEDDAASPPHSPNVDEKSAKLVSVSRMVMRQLRVEIHSDHQNVLEALVTPNLQPACFVVSRVIFSKLGNTNWRIIQSHDNGGTARIYIKMRSTDMRRFHAKKYGFMGEEVTFCKVKTMVPLKPDPMEAGPVVRLA